MGRAVLLGHLQAIFIHELVIKRDGIGITLRHNILQIGRAMLN